MSEFFAGITKVGTGLAAIAIVFGLLLIIFFIGSRAKGRLQGPVAIAVFLGPAILLLAYGLIVPAFRTTAGSFQDANGKEFVGFDNYSWIFTSPGNSTFLTNTVLWIIIAPLVSTALGLTLALLLDRMRRESVSKSLIFMPMAISFVGAGIIWGLVYEYRDPSKQQVGLLSQVTMWLGIDNPPNWLLWQPFNNFLLMVIMIWIQVGFAMVVLSAAIKAIPGDVIEAAELDGATGWRLFSRVTIPMIRGTLIVVLTTIMIAVLKIFDIVRTMTNGNFGTQVVANEMYAQAFVAFDVGKGSALAVVLFVGVIPLIAYNVIQLRKERDDPMSVEAHEIMPIPMPREESIPEAAKRKLSSPWATGLVILITILWTIPTFGLLVTSLRPREQAQNSGWWTIFSDPTMTLSNYAEVITGGATIPAGIAPYFWNSFAIAIPSAIFPLLIATMAAYAIAWIPFRGATYIFFGIFALQVIPLQMSLLPLLQMFSKGWTLGPLTIFPDLNKPGTEQSLFVGTYVPLWIAHTMFALPLAIFLLHNFINQLPRELFEAARVDGASHFLIFRKLVLPLSVPAIASIAIFQFLWVWNDLLVALTFAGGTPDVAPITAYLANIKGTYGAQLHLITAGAFIAIIVPLIVFFSLQRFFVRGLLAGSVKG